MATKDKQISSSLAKNTILLAIGNILTKGLLFVMIPFFSRWLSTEDYGTFDLFCTYVSLLIPLITLSTGEAMFRFSIQGDSTNEKIKTYISNCFYLIIINCSFLVLFLILIRFIFDWKLAIPFLLLFLGELFNSFLQSFLRSIKKLNIYSFCNAFSVVLISILVTFFVKYMNLGLSGIIYGYAFGYLLGDIFIALFTKLYNYIDFKKLSTNQIKELIKYSYPLIPNSISWWIVNVSDRFIIKVVMGVAYNGIYAIANKIPAICTAVFSVFNISWQQDASEYLEKKDFENAKKYFNHIYNSMIKILISICIIILSTNFILFKYIFDAKYYSAYLYSPILITSIIFMLLSQFYGGIQISLKNPKANGITTVIGAFCNIMINVLTIKWFGLYAAAISTLLSYLIVDALRKYKLKEIVSFKINKSNYILIAVYLYFLISSYFIECLSLSIVNLFAASIIFIVINKDYIIKIINKVLRRF